MPYHLTADEIARIEDALRESPEVITLPYIQQLATTYQTTVQTIYKHKRRIEVGIPVGRRSGGPRPVITWKMEQVIK